MLLHLGVLAFGLALPRQFPARNQSRGLRLREVLAGTLYVADHCGAETCDACVAAGCGWCASERRCVAGTANGPRGSTCLWEYGQCSLASEPCASRGSCGACTADGECGWCESIGQCVAGPPAGPPSCEVAGTTFAWVHAYGLFPTCRPVDHVSNGAVAADPARLVEAEAEARRAKLEAEIAAQRRARLVRSPCPTPDPTPAPTTTTTTTPEPTTPAPRITSIYFVPPQPAKTRPMLPPASARFNITRTNATPANATNTTSASQAAVMNSSLLVGSRDVGSRDVGSREFAASRLAEAKSYSENATMMGSVATMFGYGFQALLR